jgi:hypothetical protein
MRRGFIWLSGGDPTILARCTNLSRSEQTRFANLGALTLVPAILGACGMAYAFSTLTDRPFLYIGAGLVWGLIVLCIDRYLISTLHKSSRRHLGSMAFSVLVRLLFAVLIGVAIAHPLVLLWFNGSIEQTIDQNRQTAVTARANQANAEIAAVPQVKLTATPLQQQLTARTNDEDCLLQLQTYEESSYASIKSACGVTSGHSGCQQRCKQIGDQITEVKKEIADLTTSLTAAQKVDGTALKNRQSQIDAITKRATDDTASINGKFSNDYLARVAAVEQLEKRSPQVRIVNLFMIGFFVFVDIMPLLMKLSTPMGEYERIRDTALLKAVMSEEAKQDVITKGEAEAALAKMYAEAELALGEMHVMTRVPIEMLKAWDEHRIQVEQQINLIRQRTRRDDEHEVEAQIIKFRRLDQQAWETAMGRTMAFVDGSDRGSY